MQFLRVKIFMVMFFLMSGVFLTAQEDATIDDYLALFDEITGTQEEQAVDTGSAGDSMTEYIRFNGEHIFDYSFPVIADDLDFEGYLKAPKVLNKLGIKAEYGDLNLTANWSLDLVMDDDKEWENYFTIKPLENVIFWSPDVFKLGMGWQNIAWGTADEQNPTDNVNPRDYTRSALGSKLPVFSLTASLYPAAFISIDVVYIPIEQEDILPVDFAKEIPSDIFNAISIADIDLASFPKPELTFTSVPGEKDITMQEIPLAPGATVAGAKMNFYLSDLDFSVSYLYDWDSFYTPVIELEKYQLGIDPNVVNKIKLALFLPPQVKLALLAQLEDMYACRVKSMFLKKLRLHRVGFDLRSTIDRFGLWLESCYTITEDVLMESYKIRNPNLSWVVGYDFNYGDNDECYFNLQQVGKWIPGFYYNFYTDYEDGEPDTQKLDDKNYLEEYFYRGLVDKLGMETEELLLGFILNLEWNLLDELLTPTITGAYFWPVIYDEVESARYGSLFLNPEFVINPQDAFYIKIGTELFLAWHKMPDEDEISIDATDRVGRLYKDSNVYLQVEYSWGGLLK